jgi:membrane protein YqaA with SNARE-associated domain
MLAYATMFGTALLAATILPFYSEVVLIALLSQNYSPFWLWFYATAGNTLGAIVNWVLGKYLLRFSDRKWFPFKPDSLQRSQRIFRKYGSWTLLFSWLPVGGDALTFIAGMMKVRLLTLVVLCAAGKGARYFVIIYLS